MRGNAVAIYLHYNNTKKLQISYKLREKLNTAPTSESDVVYILSIVRKILEIDSKEGKYDCLNSYCNLALHSKIDRLPKSFHEMLIRVKEGGTDPKAYQNSIILLNDFHPQFQKFLKDYDMPNIIYTEKYGITNFNKLLYGIFSDTPIILTIEV